MITRNRICLNHYIGQEKAMEEYNSWKNSLESDCEAEGRASRLYMTPPRIIRPALFISGV